MKNILKFSECLACIQLMSIINSFVCNMSIVDWFNGTFFFKESSESRQEILHQVAPETPFQEIHQDLYTIICIYCKCLIC